MSKKKYKSPFGWLFGARTAIKEKIVEIEEPAVNKENDEMLNLCSPVRASKTEPQVGTWLTNNKCIFR